MISRLIFSPLVLLVSTAITGCSGWGDVPYGLRVGTGLEPEYIDQQVRFRTTSIFVSSRVARSKKLIELTSLKILSPLPNEPAEALFPSATHSIGFA